MCWPLVAVRFTRAWNTRNVNNSDFKQVQCHNQIKSHRIGLSLFACVECLARSLVSHLFRMHCLLASLHTQYFLRTLTHVTNVTQTPRLHNTHTHTHTRTDRHTCKIRQLFAHTHADGHNCCWLMRILIEKPKPAILWPSQV